MASFTRSSSLMSADDTALLVIDVQERLVASMTDRARLVWNVRRLIDGARVLNLPVLATEQYPAGLGKTVDELSVRLGIPTSKMTFSCCGCTEAFSGIVGRGIRKLLLCGMETHVCVQQTALDLMAGGWQVYLAADAVASRFAIDHETAIRRMDSAGATITTTEAALFEWCQIAGTPEFKQISRLVRETRPDDSGSAR